jgi:hypothetical protein
MSGFDESIKHCRRGCRCADGASTSFARACKMSDSQCPICYTSLEVTDVAPCMECGNIPQEIEQALTGKHSYAEMDIR